MRSRTFSYSLRWAPAFAILFVRQFTNSAATAGQVTGYSDGNDEFRVAFAGSTRCTGNWAVRDPNPTIVIPISCGPRVRGEAIVTLNNPQRG